MIALLVAVLSACSAATKLYSEGNLSGPMARPVEAGVDRTELLLETMEDRGFLLCDWLKAAIEASSVPLSIDLDPIYALDDPVPSGALTADPAGSEVYVLSEGKSSVSCDVRGYARDLTYGHKLTGAMTIRLDAHRVADSIVPKGEEYRKAVIMRDRVWLNDRLRVDLSPRIGVSVSDYTPLLRAIVDQWHDGNIASNEGSASAISWNNLPGFCGSLDSALISALLPTGNEYPMTMEASGYERTATPWALGCKFKRDTRSKASGRVEVVFDRYYSEDKAVSEVDRISSNACAAVGEFYFVRCDEGGSAGSWLEAVGTAGASMVTIRAFSWEKQQIEPDTYMGLMHELFENARQLAAEAG